jgi:ElaB/YqjD/DUF883 family membrane-anchored ribosome-binding protein
MNETIEPNDARDAPWLTHEHRLGMPDSPAAPSLPEAEKAPTAAVASLNRIADTAHDAVDRFADSAAPKVRQLGESMAGAEAALHEKADQLGRARDEWAEGLRGTVRSHPLAAVAGAAVLGAVIARVTR